jgi:hypothetical protein
VTRFEKSVTLDVAAIKRRLSEASKSGNLPNVTFRACLTWEEACLGDHLMCG